MTAVRVIALPQSFKSDRGGSTMPSGLWVPRVGAGLSLELGCYAVALTPTPQQERVGGGAGGDAGRGTKAGPLLGIGWLLGLFRDDWSGFCDVMTQPHHTAGKSSFQMCLFFSPTVNDG